MVPIRHGSTVHPGRSGCSARVARRAGSVDERVVAFVSLHPAPCCVRPPELPGVRASSWLKRTVGLANSPVSGSPTGHLCTRVTFLPPQVDLARAADLVACRATPSRSAWLLWRPKHVRHTGEAAAVEAAVAVRDAGFSAP